MALVDTTWYCNSVGYTAVTAWAAATVAAGVLRRQTAATVGNERVFICVVAGTTGGVEPTWVLTRGAKTTDGTVTWMEVTGQAALNSDLTNTATWAQVKPTGAAVLGQIIKRSNNASYQICTTAGAMSASEPTFSDTAGVTTTDTTAVWTSLGAVSNFTGGQAPHARLAAATAITWFAVNNTVYVGDNHAESQSTTLTVAPTGAPTVMVKVLCHNHSGSYPPAAGDLTTGATISTTGTAAISINPAGGCYFYGLTLKAGVGGSTGPGVYMSLQGTSNPWTYWENCSFQIATTVSGGLIQIGAAAGPYNIILNNCTVSFANVGDSISVVVSQLIWKNTGQILFSGSSVPTTLFNMSSASSGQNNISLEALDLSQLTGSLFASGSVYAIGNLSIKDCKLNASTTVTTPGAYGMVVQAVRSDSSATAYKSTRYAYEGTETTETSITRVGGAVDPNGQAQTRKLITTANAQWLRAFFAEPYAIWNTVTGANVTVTVYGTVNSVSLPLNDEIFMEVEYLASSHPGVIVTTTKATLLSTGAAVASDNSVWNGGGSGVGWSPFKLVATVTPGMAGVIEARIRAAKISTTYYIDPQIVLS